MTTESLSETEIQLLLELLQVERGDLPSEIRRTFTYSVHDDLQDRRKLVEALIEKLQHALAG